MKKIICSLLLIFLLVSFTSCKSDNVSIVDNPKTEILEALKLNDVKNGTELNANRGKAPYYDVKISNDVKGSLFYQTINVNSEVSEKTKVLNLKPLVFSASFADPANATLAEFLTIMNDQTNGITKEKLGVSFADDDNSDYLVGKLTAENTISVPSNLTFDNADPVQLVVVYIPVYGIFVSGEDYNTNVYLMMPVYYAFATTSTVSNYITEDIKNFQCDELVEAEQGVWVLPSNN